MSDVFRNRDQDWMSSPERPDVTTKDAADFQRCEHVETEGLGDELIKCKRCFRLKEVEVERV